MRISMLNEAAPLPNRLNEDTCYVASNGSEALVVVADGAGQRLPTTQTADLLNWRGTPITAARFAALTVQNAARDYPDPAEILLQANENIAWNLEHVYDELSAAALVEHEPHLAPYLKDDPRWLRLALPVCVATAARMHADRLDYAHAGDTALLIFYADGHIEVPTTDQMGRYDAAALQLAQQLQMETGAAHLAAVLDHPRVQQANQRSGLYHNYVDEHGQPDRSQGVGVINGLPQLETYMQCGSIDLADVAGVLLCSDGGLWPAPLTETATARDERLRQMRRIIERDGLDGYYQQLRQAEAADCHRDRYPRFKIHDDCTVVYVEL